MTKQVPLLICVLVALSGFCVAQETEPAKAKADPKAQADQALLVETEQAAYEAIREADYSRALLICERGRERGLPLSRYHLLKAKIYAAMRDVKSEEEQLRGAIYRDPKLVEAYLRLAAIKLTSGLWLDACKLYRDSIAANPEGLAAYTSLALTLKENGRTRTAIQTLETAREIAPRDPFVLSELASLYEFTGDFAKAREEYRKAARSSTGEVRLDALEKVGDLSLKMDDGLTAFAFYRAGVAEGLQVTEERYLRIATSCDATTWSLLDHAWYQFQAFIADSTDRLEREALYQLLEKMLDEERQVAAFVDTLKEPEPLRAEHALRKLQGALVCETLVNAVSYLDTGDESLVSDARDRHADAVAQQTALAKHGQ